MNRKNIISDLKLSARQFGTLYPVLVDKEGNVLDGAHRLKAMPDWPRMQLDYIQTEEDRLIVRLIGNVCRRSVSSAEKNEIVNNLARIYISQGLKPGQVPYKIAKETGMSYRWVMIYLSNTLKSRPGAGGPTRVQRNVSCRKEDIVPVVSPATLLSDIYSHTCTTPVSIINYANTRFVNILLEKKIYSKIETASHNLGISPETIIGNALFSVIKCLSAYTHTKDEGEPQELLSAAG